MKNKIRARTRGFSLIEILVCIAILLTLTNIIYPTFQKGMEAYFAVRDGMEALQTAKLSMQKLSLDLRQSRQVACFAAPETALKPEAGDDTAATAIAEDTRENQHLCDLILGDGIRVEYYLHNENLLRKEISKAGVTEEELFGPFQSIAIKPVKDLARLFQIDIAIKINRARAVNFGPKDSLARFSSAVCLRSEVTE